MQNYPKISIGIILYKNEKYIPYFLGSLLKQNYQWKIEILLRDNDKNLIATIKIKEFLEKNKNLISKNISIRFFNWKNIWHSWWQNFLMSKMTGEIYICASNDMFYPKFFLSEIMQNMLKNDKKIFYPKSMIWDFDKIKVDNIDNSLTNIIDSFWLWISEKHYFFDIWQWQKESVFKLNKDKVFWCSGSLIIFKKEIIWKLISKFWFIFDEKSVPQYKNDIDLFYRINATWEEIILLENIKVYHDRQLWNELVWNGRVWNWQNWNWQNRQYFFWNLKKNNISAQQSIFWHLIILQKFIWNFWFKTKVKIYFYELQKFIFIMIFKTKNLKAYFAFFREKNRIKKIKINKENLEKIIWKFQ